MKRQAVIGLGFGDEGKGLVTDYLSSWLPDSLVVRYSGGHQAGHTVCRNGIRHVFSNFGSGTLNGTPTYWSPFCTIDPVGIQREYNALERYGPVSSLFIHQDCPVTTPYDIYASRAGKYLKNGTCGLGFGATIQREEDYYHLKFRDLEFPSVLRMKLDQIRKYYQSTIPVSEEFIQACEFVSKNFTMTSGVNFIKNYIFEGSQGLLLDQNIGFFPHVTRSNTGTKNILKMCHNPELFLVTRAYQTRHGNGPMTHESIPRQQIENPNETNIQHPYQGSFRKAVLDLDLILYAIYSEDYIRDSKRTICVTCLDQVEGRWQIMSEGVLETFQSEDSFIEFIEDMTQSDVLRFRSEVTPGG